ncbi:MAG: DMT family transporter [Cyanobacteriota bacterium]|nr:DMT family transporter [Cyanobacteriota bacterium]
MPLATPLRWLLMMAPFALWGTSMAAMKPLLEGCDPFLLASLRLLPAGVVVVVAAALLGRPLAVAPQDRPWLLLFALIDASLFQGLLAHGLSETGAGLGSVLIDCQPLFVALLARALFGEAINPVGWVGLMLGLVGILLLGLPGGWLRHWWLQGPPTTGGDLLSRGEWWMLGAAAAMAVGTVLCRYATRQSDPVAVTGWHMLIGGMPLLVASLSGWQAGSHGLLPDWTSVEWGLMAYASLFGSALAYGLFFFFASRGDLTGFTALTFLTPVFAVFCGVLFLEEQLHPQQWLGAGLALVSVLLIHQRGRLWGDSAGQNGAEAVDHPVTP